FTPRGIHAQISNAKNQLIGPAEYASRVASFYDQTVADVYELYQKRMFAANAVDFADMLYLTVDVLERFPEAQERWQKSFRYILVDEYQDTNHAQYRFLQLLAAKHNNVFAVGDPDQCLVAGTEITMADGARKPIEEVRVGDEVLTCHGSGVFGPGRVIRTHRSSRRAGIAITTVSGRRLESTPEHVHFAGFTRPDGEAERATSRFDSPTSAAGAKVCGPITVTLCGGSSDERPSHWTSLTGDDEVARSALQRLGFPVTHANRRSGVWKYESSYADFEKLHETVDLLRKELDVSVRYMARLATRSDALGKERNSLPFVPAASVRPGMVMIDENGEFDLVESVERVALDGPVYDLDIESTHNFVANG